MKYNTQRLLLISALLAGLLTFFVYIFSLQNGFVNWDDWLYISDNSAVTAFDLKRLLTENLVSNWHPVTMVSLAVDFLFWGLDPFGYHLTNNILHAFNVFLVCMLAAGLYNLALSKKTDSYTIAAGVFSALLWGLHPQHVESVAWVSERKDVLSMSFFLLSLLSYLKYKISSRPLYYISAIITFLLALLSKPIAISLPIVLLLLDLYPLKYNWHNLKRLVLEKVPFFIFSALSAFSTLRAQDQALISMESLDFTVRLLNAVRAYAFYIYKMFIPFGLVPYYPLMPHDIPLLHSLLSLFLLIAVSLFCLFYILKGKRVFIAVWLYYLITLFPVIGIVQVGGQAAADRYTYLPSISLIVLFCGGLIYFTERSAKPKLIYSLSAVMFAILTVLGGLTIKQISIWKDSVSLWSHEIEFYPIVFAYENRAKVYLQSGEYEKAIEDLSVIIESGNYNGADVYTRRGVCYHKTGKIGMAIKDYKKALEFSPENAKMNFRLGVAYFEAGDMPLSALYLKKASQLGSDEARDFLFSKNITGAY